MLDLPDTAVDPDTIGGKLITVGIAVLIAIVVHVVSMAIIRRATPHGATAGETPSHFIRWPLLSILVAIAVAASRRVIDLPTKADALWNQIAGLLIPALLGWLLVNLIRFYVRTIELRYDIAVEDNLRARRRRTRSAILGRIAIILVAVFTIALMLLSIPSIRSVGVTLMASAGIAGLAVGAAAQPALKNLIAGVQMAFTEPIRLDDVVIIEGEWGKIEEIRLTYVVVALWDERRLVVPVSKFLEEPFQNWTRQSSRLLGSVFLYLDPTVDVPRLRAHFETLVAANPRWDRRAQVLQVTDSKPDAVEIRMLATAKDGPTAFDLRCDIREGMLAFIGADMPEALPRRRIEWAQADGPVDPAANTVSADARSS